jgi:hypothetical protein
MRSPTYLVGFHALASLSSMLGPTLSIVNNKLKIVMTRAGIFCAAGKERTQGFRIKMLIFIGLWI